MASQLHFNFALWINIVALKLENLVLVKVGGFWLFGVKFQNAKSESIFVIFTQNPPTLTSTRFSSFRATTLIQSAKWSWGAILLIFENFGTRRNFCRQQISGSKSGNFAPKSTKIADFSRNPVEISEVLPVEISTMKSGMKKFSLENKIMSFGPTVEILKQNVVYPPPGTLLDRISLIFKGFPL